MLDLDATTVRVFLHVLAATIWVGGQLTLAGLLSALRTIGPDAPRAAARRFNVIAWPAYAVLVGTGIWNLFERDLGDRSTEWQVTLFVKLVIVALSGVAALTHSMSRSKVVLAVGGALAGLTSLTALLLGVQLTFGG